MKQKNIILMLYNYLMSYQITIMMKRMKMIKKTMKIIYLDLASQKDISQLNLIIIKKS